MTRPFLKYPGNKYRLVDRIRALLPTDKDVLIELCAGSCAVFLGTDYKAAILNDANTDLINLYRTLQYRGATFIEDARSFFVPKNNTPEVYYRYRDRFNRSRDAYERALLFLFLGRHNYNGMIRYNASGGYNVPAGKYKKVYFPAEELYYFYDRCQVADFTCENYSKVFRRARKLATVYADPPYFSLSRTANFTTYTGIAFEWADQVRLKNLALSAAQRGVPVLISNHDTPETRKLYHDARLHYLKVTRHISCKVASRKPCRELLALYSPPASAVNAA